MAKQSPEIQPAESGKSLAVFDPNDVLDELSPIALMDDEFDLRADSTLAKRLAEVVQKYYGNRVPTVAEIRKILGEIAKNQSVYESQGGVPKELFEEKDAADTKEADEEVGPSPELTDRVIDQQTEKTPEVIAEGGAEELSAEAQEPQDKPEGGESLDAQEGGNQHAPAEQSEGQGELAEEDKPVFEGLSVPEKPLSEESAARGAVAVASAIEEQKSGVLSREQVTEAMQATTAGEIDKAEKIIILGKKEHGEAPIPEELLRKREQSDPAALIDDLRSAFLRVNRQVIGREELLVQTLYALLTREHQLIYSRAGMAKSLYAASVFGQFKGAKTFSIQMTKGTTEEGLVGAVDIQELKKGNIVHNTQGTIVDARLAFLDEIFDSNDVALRSLLGILNERLFRKGKQYVEAVLHSAIATSNYVRSSEITEAVVDRFPFRAYLLPDKDPYNLLRIDETYGKNTGRVAVPNEDEKIPFEHVEYLSDIVEGKVPSKEIFAPPHILFLKNAVILEYMRLVNEERAKKKTPDLYVSPRTMAKTRDILNASALLRGRTELREEDLTDLKYMVCTIGDQEHQEQIFAQALKNVMTGVTKEDLETVDLFMEAHTLLEAILAKRDKGEEIQPTMFERIKIFFGVSSLSELTFGQIRKSVSRFQPRHPLVNELKESILGRIKSEGERKNKIF